MYSKQQIIDTLNNEDIFIDNFLLEAFIKNWKIEPIYEDSQGIEFFDDMAIEKIKNGILQKQPKCEINIIDKDSIKPVEMSVEFHECHEVVDAVTEVVQEDTVEVEECFDEIKEELVIGESQDVISEKKSEIIADSSVSEVEITENSLPLSIINEVNKEVENELKNVTLDISNQTLTVLAESIARKITCDVSEFIKKTDLIEDAVQLGEYKKDNQILLEKIDELIADNRALIQKVKELEKNSGTFVKLFGNVYVKNK